MNAKDAKKAADQAVVDKALAASAKEQKAEKAAKEAKTSLV